MSKKKHVKPTRSGGKAASTSVPQPSAPPAPSRSVSGPLLYAGVAVLVVLVVFLGVLLMRSNISAPIVTTAPAVSATATLASAGADKTSASDEFSEPLASFAPLPLEISVQQAASMRAQGAFVLDVREPFEWEQIHIPDATLIPLGTLAQRVSELPKDKDIVVVCRSGNRSQTGRDILLQAGFKRVTSMAGGMNQWRAAGLPTTSGP